MTKSTTCLSRTASILDALRKLKGILEVGWCQGTDWKMTDEGECYCLHAAMVTLGSVWLDLLEPLGFQSVDDLILWNDDPLRTKKEILTRIDSAIKVMS